LAAMVLDCIFRDKSLKRVIPDADGILVLWFLVVAIAVVDEDTDPDATRTGIE